MCLPAMAMAALSVASTAVSIGEEVQQANYQNKAISNQLAQGEKQVQQQEVSDINSRDREARKEQGRMAVAAGEAGLQLSSGSVENMLLNSAMQANLSNANTELNAKNQDENLVDEANRYYSQVQMPSIIGAGLRLVSSGVVGYDQGVSAAYKRQVISKTASNAAGAG